jgi:predicted signal transduction protein with EAL and GGDEF domain
MTVDDAGLIWITNFWLAVGFLLIALGLTLFSHGWIATGRAPRPRRMAVRMRRRRQRPAGVVPASPRPTPLTSWQPIGSSPRRASLPSRRLVA